MTDTWQRVPLEDVLHRSDETIALQPGTVYREVTVRLWGKGVVLRGEVSSSEVAAPRRFVARRGQFILSRIDARHGALGIVPHELDGAIVTNDFPVFSIDARRLLPEYLGWICRTAGFVEECRRASEGTTNRVRLQEHRFLARAIPLPPLSEQRRAVTRLAELSGRIEEARLLRRRASLEADALLSAAERRLWPSAGLGNARPLASVTTFLSRGRQSAQGPSEHFLIKTQHVQLGRYLPTPLRLAPHAAAKVHPAATVRDGDILIACSAAGCLGRVAWYRSDGRTASTDTHVAIARPDPSLVEPSYLYAYLSGAQGQHQLRSRERGDWRREKVGFRLTELNLKDLKEVPVPVPARVEQRRIVAQLNALRVQVDALKRHQADTAADLDALLPSILNRVFRGAQ